MEHVYAAVPTLPTAAARERRATLMLLLVTMIWGLSFSWLKDWQIAADECPGGALQASLILVAIRMTLAFLVVTAVMPRLVFGPTWKEHAAGVAVGISFLIGHVLQVWGISSTTPALSALLTSLCSAWVPFVAWAFLGQRPGLWTIVGFAFAITGTMVISHVGFGGGVGEGLQFGDWLTFVASLAFAGQVLVLDRLGRYARPGHLTAGFFAGPGLVSIILAVVVSAAGPGLTESWRWAAATLSKPAVDWNIVQIIAFPTVLGFHWMNLYQPRMSASRAALIYLFEPVFAAMYSVFRGYDVVTSSLLIGGLLILSGNALAEAPNWLSRRA